MRRLPNVTGIFWRVRSRPGDGGGPRAAAAGGGPRGRGTAQRLAAPRAGVVVALAAAVSAGGVIAYSARHGPLSSDGAWTDDRALAAVVAPAPAASAPPAALLLRATYPVEVLRAGVPAAVAGPEGLRLRLPAGADVLVVGRAGTTVSAQAAAPPAPGVVAGGTWVIPADGRLQLVLGGGRAQGGGAIMRP